MRMVDYDPRPNSDSEPPIDPRGENAAARTLGQVAMPLVELSTSTPELSARATDISTLLRILAQKIEDEHPPDKKLDIIADELQALLCIIDATRGIDNGIARPDTYPKIILPEDFDAVVVEFVNNEGETTTDDIIRLVSGGHNHIHPTSRAEIIARINELRALRLLKRQNSRVQSLATYQKVVEEARNRSNRERRQQNPTPKTGTSPRQQSLEDTINGAGLGVPTSKSAAHNGSHGTRRR